MQFTLASAFNATAEIAAIGTTKYANIRVFTVGDGTTSDTPLLQLGSIVQPWAAATSAVVGLGTWSSFSATCWFFVRDVFDALNGTVPIGVRTTMIWVGVPLRTRSRLVIITAGSPWFGVLRVYHPHLCSLSPARCVSQAISNNWGGTIIETWSSSAALAACNKTVDTTTTTPPVVAFPTTAGNPTGPDPNGHHVLWDSMVVPYTSGPMSVKGFTWFQGTWVHKHHLPPAVTISIS